MKRPSANFILSLDALRMLGGWAADCADRALPLFERRAPNDSRPRAAIEAIRAFAAGEKRTARLRSLACAAHAAARDVGEPAAAAAARAAGLAAACAYTHPLAVVHQTLHVVGPAAYAALALEQHLAGNTQIGRREVRRAIRRAPPDVPAILRHMPPRPAGTSRRDVLLHALDAGLRRLPLPPAPAPGETPCPPV